MYEDVVLGFKASCSTGEEFPMRVRDERRPVRIVTCAVRHQSFEASVTLTKICFEAVLSCIKDHYLVISTEKDRRTFLRQL